MINALCDLVFVVGATVAVLRLRWRVEKLEAWAAEMSVWAETPCK